MNRDSFAGWGAALVFGFEMISTPMGSLISSAGTQRTTAAGIVHVASCFLCSEDRGFARIGRQEFPDPFVPKPVTWKCPSDLDFIGTVDFNRDGQMDIVTASRGQRWQYLLAARAWRLQRPQRIVLPGVVIGMSQQD